MLHALTSSRTPKVSKKNTRPTFAEHTIMRNTPSSHAALPVLLVRSFQKEVMRSIFSEKGALQLSLSLFIASCYTARHMPAVSEEKTSFHASRQLSTDTLYLSSHSLMLHLAFRQPSHHSQTSRSAHHRDPLCRSRRAPNKHCRCRYAFSCLQCSLLIIRCLGGFVLP